MNNTNVVEVEIALAIKPKHIHLASIGHPLVGTLGKYEFEAFAAQFVFYSQQTGCWVGFSFDERAEARSVYTQMVDKSLLFETETSDGRWLYQLTPLTVSQIYLAQSEATIFQLALQLRRAREESLLSRIKRHLKGVFAAMSPSI